VCLRACHGQATGDRVQIRSIPMNRSMTIPQLVFVQLSIMAHTSLDPFREHSRGKSLVFSQMLIEVSRWSSKKVHLNPYNSGNMKWFHSAIFQFSMKSMKWFHSLHGFTPSWPRSPKASQSSSSLVTSWQAINLVHTRGRWKCKLRWPLQPWWNINLYV
jgi:hypothetical protein